MKNYTKILNIVKQEALRKLKSESTGHGYWHAYRVAQTAQLIAKKERANVQVAELAAWLHDIQANPDKDHEIRSAKFAQKFLTKLNVDENIVNEIVYCVKNHRFSKGVKPKTLEGKIVQDSDKLDALGAIGLARLFIISGKVGQTLYDPSLKPSFDYYLKHGVSNTTVNHFYDKLFKLKKLLHTKTARKIAQERERFMRQYLKRFYLEWDGEKCQ